MMRRGRLRRIHWQDIGFGVLVLAGWMALWWWMFLAWTNTLQ